VVVVVAAAVCVGAGIALTLPRIADRGGAGNELLSTAGLAAACLATVLIAFRLASPPADEASREYGIYLALLAALVALGGAVLSFLRGTAPASR
jgi:hypothetical protein